MESERSNDAQVRADIGGAGWEYEHVTNIRTLYMQISKTIAEQNKKKWKETQCIAKK